MLRRLRIVKNEVTYVLSTLLIILIVAVAFVIVFLFLVLYSLAMLGPLFGRFFDVDDRVYRALDRVVGVKNMHRFREDIRDLIARHTGDLKTGLSKFELRREIRQNRAEAKTNSQDGDFFLAILSGGLSILAQAIYPLSPLAWWVGFYAFLSTIAITFRVAIIDILAYGNEDDVDSASKPELILMDGWNRAILSSSKSQAGILIVGFLVGFDERGGYKLGRNILDEVASRDMTRVEAAVFVGMTMYKIIEYNFWGLPDDEVEE